MDGGSTDGTVDIIKRYSQKIDVFVSEPDKGIFDAMNKSLDHVTGDYVIFINSGDKFVCSTTVADVFLQDLYNADLVYGDVYVQNHLGYKFDKAEAIYTKNSTKHDFVFKSQGFCHQSLFTKTSILKRIKFDIAYKIGADYDTTAKVYRQGNHRLHYTNFPIAVFDDRTGGASHNQIRQMYAERFRMFGYTPTCMDKLRIKKELATRKIKNSLEVLFPKIVGKRRQRKYIQNIS